MKKIWLLLLPVSLCALEVEPWFGDLYEFRFMADYTYSRYNKVDHGVPSLEHPSNDQLIELGLALSPADCWDVDCDIEIVNTPRQSWGYRSFAFQVRRLWLDDIAGDPISFDTGVYLRNVSQKSLKDVSCPYHSAFDMEMNLALGKEWSRYASWLYRIFGFGGLGIYGNQGSVWLKGIASLQGNYSDKHRGEISSVGYFGFGNQEEVFIDHFHGYGKIHHKSVDIGLTYTYVLDIWGKFSFQYAHRVYARSFPANTNFFTLSYTLPFSYF